MRGIAQGAKLYILAWALAARAFFVGGGVSVTSEGFRVCSKCHRSQGDSAAVATRKLMRYSALMTFIHTSDWHLGKMLREVSLIEDQRHFLDQLLSLIEVRQPDALVISGDIYDKAVPPTQAVSLLSGFLFTLTQRFPRLHVFMLSGNHDSSSRLSFASEILESANIHIATNAANCATPVLLGEGEGRAALYQIPFLLQGSFSDTDGNPLRRQGELLDAACSKIRSFHEAAYPDVPVVVAAHVFAGGAQAGGSESSCVGTAEMVDATLFRGFDYVALGHIHRMQRVGEANVYYSGSPLPYDFGEANDKAVLFVEVSRGAVSVERVGLDLLRRVVRLEGTVDSFLDEGSPAVAAHKGDFVEVVCTDGAASENPMSLLKQVFPNLLSFRIKRAEGALPNKAIEARRRVVEQIAGEDFGQAFRAFIAEVYGEAGEAFALEQQCFDQIAQEVRQEESV